MAWNITYYSDEVQEEILSWPAGIKARYIKITDLMLTFGANLGMPHTRAMGEGLFEIRLRSREGIGRVLYCTYAGQQIIMLHCFIKKTDKTPQRELETARKRQKEVLDNAKS